MSHLEDIARRRAANTGESYEAALATVARLMADQRGDADRGGQEWVAGWTADVPWEDGAAPWLLAHHVSMRPLIEAFPVLCVVRARVELMTPAPGTCGIVQSWLAPRADAPRGLVCVIQHPTGIVGAQCYPEQLEVVGYWRGWTPERVRQVFAEAG